MLNFFKRIFGSLKTFTVNIFTLFRSKNLLKRVLYTLLLLLIFRLAATITTPGIVIKASNWTDKESSFVGIMNMMGGGALSNFSIVALGISPYITASIIMTLLQSEAFPAFYRLSKSGPNGKRKINIITRVLTIFFAIIQAITIIQQFRSQLNVSLHESVDKTWYQYIVLPIILLAGSMFTMFLGEQITENGVGNGTSLIIFSGIAADLPAKFKLAFEKFFDASRETSSFVGLMNFFFYCAFFLFLIFVVGYFHLAERHVPIQQTGSGLTKDVKQMSRLPIKLNPAGVMPIIFALTISVLPLTIVQFFHHQNETRIWIEENMQLTDPIGLSIFVAIIFLFSIVMGLVTFNPFTIADNFKKNGTFIPGIRPGEETEKYLTAITIRLSVFSAIYLSILSSIQYIQQIMGIEATLTIGGTSMIILVTASLETIDQLKARDTTQSISRARQKAIASVDGGNTTGGLLW